MFGFLRSAASQPKRFQEESRSVVLSDDQHIQVRLVRDRRCRNMRLSVDDRGVRVSSPTRTSWAAAERFIRQNAQWLLQQLQQQASLQGAAFDRSVERVTLFGNTHRILWREGRFLSFEFQPDQLMITAPATASAAQLQKLLGQFYRQQAQQFCQSEIQQQLASLPRAPRAVGFKMLRSIWGSLSPQDRISLDLSLVLCEPDALRYVLIHELCHMVHANHSSAFWREVAKRMPQWQGVDQWLSEHGAGLKMNMRSLLNESAINDRKKPAQPFNPVVQR